MRKIREVLRLKYELGFTHRTIAKALRVAVGTVSEYLAKAKKGGLSWPLPEELSDGELEAGLFPPPGSSGARPGLDYAHIHEELRRHRELTLLQLWVEYAENKPGAYGYSRYCELYGQWKKKLNPTMRQRHRAGEKTFVDFFFFFFRGRSLTSSIRKRESSSKWSCSSGRWARAVTPTSKRH